eukprot:14910947-Alexandrium_andersonii.AAC.1
MAAGWGVGLGQMTVRTSNAVDVPLIDGGPNQLFSPKWLSCVVRFSWQTTWPTCFLEQPPGPAQA